MTTLIVLTWLAVGLCIGWLAKIAVADGGFGLGWDLLLGVGGSSVASVAFWGLGASVNTGAFEMAVAAVVGAATTIVAQRNVWSAPPIRRPRLAAPKPRR